MDLIACIIRKAFLNDKLTLCHFNQITTSEQRRILRCFTSECSLCMVVSLYTNRVILNALGVEDFGIYNVACGVVAI